jgi:hypothetical protein
MYPADCPENGLVMTYVARLAIKILPGGNTIKDINLINYQRWTFWRMIT